MQWRPIGDATRRLTIGLTSGMGLIHHYREVPQNGRRGSGKGDVEIQDRSVLGERPDGPTVRTQADRRETPGPVSPYGFKEFQGGAVHRGQELEEWDEVESGVGGRYGEAP